MTAAPVVLVVDASVAVKLFLPEPLAAEAAALFGLLADPATAFHVPDLFYVECANIFWKQVRRGNTTPAQVIADLNRLKVWRLTPTSAFDLIADALPIALNHGVTAYDASYVALAARLGVPLVTADQKLVQRLAATPFAPVWLGAWTPPGP
ncbi:MAG TPA: type II toxin-antitoxin system VapC family toxin [Fimbriiglobus sp.]|nr:type II toxin-antitoxin system VapC family toxin [Fimbriiglobus sp.]